MPMTLSFPVPDVVVRRVEKPRQVKEPLYSTRLWQLNHHEFHMCVDKVGCFYACNGNEVEYAPAPEATDASLALFLNGSVYGAILHQRQILPLHGSCFALHGKGVMLCGEAGAGKSSLTAAFCLKGAEFLTDDVSPVVMHQKLPYVLPRSDRIKLWENSLRELGKGVDNLRDIGTGDAKYYFPMEPAQHDRHPLHRVYVILPEKTDKVSVRPVTGAKAFEILRNEVYRWQYLSGMPENETVFMQQLMEMSRVLELRMLVRPKDIALSDMVSLLYEEIMKNA